VCGIAGFVDFRGHAPDAADRRVRAMTAALRHRGPDAEGHRVGPHAALGHRRLAIIDAAGGGQPMCAARGAVQLVFNGEIYDFQRVRATLESRGHRFASRSDTEVVLRAYLEWGEACVEHLDGMFAFAIWDERQRRLVLGRDRLGEKPLYWTRSGDRIAFASELGALRAGGLCPDAIDPEALDCYFTLGYVPAPRTIHPGVNKLRAAHVLSVGERDLRERCYWRLSFAEPRPIGLEEATEELGALLDRAVRSRMASDVPLGAFLSGGLDSSLVVEAMTRAGHGPVATHSIGFEEREFSELGLARTVATRLGTVHHEETLVPQAARVLPEIARRLDEPLADASVVPTWYACRMARRHATVVLSGDGGDEAFGGYTFRYLPHALESRLRGALPAALRAALFGPAASLWPASARLPRPLRLRTLLGNLARGDAEAFHRDLAWLRDETRAQVYADDFASRLRGFDPREAVVPLYASSDAPDALGRAQHTDLRLYMTDDVLAKVDRMSMAHSLEVRCPLLDPALLAFAAKLPASAKMAGRLGKLPLRRLAAKRLPDEVVRAPKRGFAAPASHWLRGELRPMTEDLLFGTASPVGDWLDRDVLARLWQEHLRGARDHGVFVWGVLMFALWDRERTRSAVATAAFA
jgi:asparagine synthase (glutamine-hydrolysing)